MAHPQENFHEQLESNDKAVVEKLKQTIREQFAKGTEPWLINGLYDYFMNTNSVKGMEMILLLRPPHQNHLFDRLCDSIKNPKYDLNVRVQALTLLGYIACSQSTSWLITLPEHPLFKQILKLLNTETELLTLISTLLLLIVLLPRFPAQIGQSFLDDIFNIFLRLAGWNSSVSGRVGEEQMIHLQVALYALFLRLYGMYPCNFLVFLRSNFKDKNDPVFCHTVKPMIGTVKMHPCLVTNSKESEIATERWRKKGPHDVIVECERFSLDLTDRCSHDSCQNTIEFRSRSGTLNSTVGSGTTSESTSQQQNVTDLSEIQASCLDPSFFSPSQFYNVHDEETDDPTRVTPVLIQSVIGRAMIPVSQGSPPEAAIEATPETTPVRDFTEAPPPQPKSNVARAFTSFRSVPGAHIISGTPTNSVPSSPLRKDASQFVFPTSSGSNLSQTLAHRLTQERQGSELQSKPPPSSPLKIVSTEPPRQRPESPVSQEDEEVSSISVTASQSEGTNKCVARQCDSVLPDVEDSADRNGEEPEHGSPCAAGGLHMPNSKSINSFKNRIRRFRYHSQCNPEIDRTETSTGSSPGNGLPALGNSTVRRANSCPDMKKSPHAALPIDRNTKPFYETDEETVSDDHSNGVVAGTVDIPKPPATDSATQTEVFWPMPYEHLFLSIFPLLRDDLAEVKTTATVPASALHQTVEPNRPSLYDLLDKYVECCVAASENQNSARDQVQLTQYQIKLLQQQLLFERHRREMHAYRNRTLLSDAKNTRLFEEYNSALKDQVQLGQKVIDDLRQQLDECKREVAEQRRIMEQRSGGLEDKCKKLIDENTILKESNRKLEAELASYKTKYNSIDKERQEAEAVLKDALAEGKVAKDQAIAGEKYKEDLQQANRELLLAGELNTKYREQLDQLTTRGPTDEEMRQICEAYREELKGLQRQVNAKTVTVEACRARIVELEHSLAAKDKDFVSQKGAFKTLSDEHAVLMEAVESKYDTQLAINRILEERILEMRMKLESEAARRRTNSPDTSSCHEVRATPTATQHSSPLSASLASSDGSAIMHEGRSLQMNVDQEGSSKTGACAADEPTNQGKHD